MKKFHFKRNLQKIFHRFVEGLHSEKGCDYSGHDDNGKARRYNASSYNAHSYNAHSGHGVYRPELSNKAGTYETGLVSIIIPCFNNERFIGDAINSALAQTYSNIEVIVIDDGSTDSSLDIIKSFGGSIISISKANSGASAARNDGLEKARGEFIQFLDGDDLLTQDAVSCRLQALGDKHDAVFADEKSIDEDGRLDGELLRYPPMRGGVREMAAYVVEHNIRTPLPLHRRRKIYEIGGFDEGLTRGQETDLHLRLVLAGHRFKHIPCFVSFRRQHRGAARLGNIDWMLEDPHRYEKLVWKWLSVAEQQSHPANSSALDSADNSNDPATDSSEIDPSPLRNVLARLLYGKANEAFLAGHPEIGFSYLATLEVVQDDFHPSGLAGLIETHFGRLPAMWYLRQKIRIKKGAIRLGF